MATAPVSSLLHGEGMFAVREDTNAARSGTHVAELAGAAHARVEPGANMDFGQGWGGIDDLGETLLPVVVKYVRMDRGARRARTALRETGPWRCHQHAVQVAVALC